MGEVHPETSIGHVHLRVSDLERSVRFYTEALGFDVMQRWADTAAFLSFGGYHHHLGLNTWGSLGGSAPAKGTTGLYHFAIRYPNRRELARALKRLLERGIQPDKGQDHGVSEALYLRDPDGNGVELFWDRAQSAWPKDPDGGLAMFNGPLDLAALLKEAE